MTDRTEYRRAWRAANRDRIKEYERRYHASHPDYRRAYVLKRYAERRQFIDEYKLSRGCIDCGYNLHACALEFDHREPVDKSFRISEAMNGNWERILAEIEKCDVRCANCHAVRTKTQALGGRPRGEVIKDGA